MRVSPNEFGFITLKTTSKSEKEFLKKLWDKGHILIVAKAIHTKNGKMFLYLGESFKRHWKRKS